MCPWGTRADRLPGRACARTQRWGRAAGVLREDAPEPPRPLGLGRSSATLSLPSRKEDRAGAWDVSHGRGGTRPRTLSLGLDAPSGARLPRTAGCYAARPVTRHPARPSSGAALRVSSPPPRGLPSHASPADTRGGVRALPPSRRRLPCQGAGVTTRSVTWTSSRVLAPGPPPQSTRCSTDPRAVDQEVGLGGALVAGPLSWGGAPQSPLPRGTWERAEVSPRHPVGWRLVPRESRTTLVTAGSQPPGAPRAVEGGLNRLK